MPAQQADESIAYLDAIEARLSARGFATARNMALPDGFSAELVASRLHYVTTWFSWRLPISQHVLIRRVDSGTPEDLKGLFSSGFKYAKAVNTVPLLRGMRFGYTIIPCIIVNHADEALIQYVESSPRKHFALGEFPVVVDLSTGCIHYWQNIPTWEWGSVLYKDTRQLVKEDIDQAVAGEN